MGYFQIDNREDFEHSQHKEMVNIAEIIRMSITLSWSLHIILLECDAVLCNYAQLLCSN
jgi:hypothetical protein